MEDNTKKESKSLDDFAGFEDTSQNFFGEADLTDPIEEKEPAGEEEEETKTKKDGKAKSDKKEGKDSKKKTKDEEDDEEEDISNLDFFKGGKEEEEEDQDGDDPKDKGKKPEEKSESLKTLEYLKSKGLVDYTDEEMEGEDKDSLLEDKWEQSLEDAVRDMTDSLPDEVKNLIKFASKGGDPKEYFRGLSNTANSKINKDSDISDTRVLKDAISEDLKMQGYDEEYIESHIETLEANKKLKSIGEKSYNKIVKGQEDDEKEKLKDIEALNKSKKEKSKQFKTDLKSFVSEIKDVKGVSISPEDKRSLPDYISDPKVELEDGRKISQFQDDLFKVMGDKEGLTLLSKLIKSDFDFSSVEKGAVTKSSRKNKENLRNVAGAKGDTPNKKSKKAIWELIT